MLKILSSLPPHPSSSLFANASPAAQGGDICYVPSRPPASEISRKRTGRKSTDLSLSLFNLTRQAALGTFQSIFKLTIYNQFSKGERKGGGGVERAVLLWKA